MKNKIALIRYKCKFFAYILIIFILSNCSDKANTDDNLPIEDAYIPKTDSTINNLSALNMVKLELEELKNSDKKDFENVIADEEAINTVSIQEVVNSLFDPENQPCPLPAKVLKKLKKFKDDKKGWAPKQVNLQIKNMPASAIYLPGTSLTHLLHTFTVKHKDGKSFKGALVGASSYQNFELDKYLLKKGFSSFIYTLDCSGYLNASIEASGVIPGADIKSKAGLAISQQSSLFIGGGVLTSPIYGAVFSEAFGLIFEPEDRISILNALVSYPGVEDDDEIITPASFEVIWTSRDGNSSFNGEANISGGASAGLGVAKISSKGMVDGTISRSSTFTNFNTYFTNSDKIGAPKTIIVKEVKILINKLSQAIKPAT